MPRNSRGGSIERWEAFVRKKDAKRTGSVDHVETVAQS